MWPFNIGDCLIKMTLWAGLTVYVNKQTITSTFIFYSVYDSMKGEELSSIECSGLKKNLIKLDKYCF
jgi:hypothetical protein